MVSIIDREVTVLKSVIFLTRYSVVANVLTRVDVWTFTRVFVVDSIDVENRTEVTVMGAVIVDIMAGLRLVTVDTLTIVDVNRTFLGRIRVEVKVRMSEVVRYEVIVTGLVTVNSIVVERSDAVVTVFLTIFTLVDTKVVGNVSVTDCVETMTEVCFLTLVLTVTDVTVVGRNLITFLTDVLVSVEVLKSVMVLVFGLRLMTLVTVSVFVTITLRGLNMVVANVDIDSEIIVEKTVIGVLTVTSTVVGRSLIVVVVRRTLRWLVTVLGTMLVRVTVLVRCLILMSVVVAVTVVCVVFTYFLIAVLTDTEVTSCDVVTVDVFGFMRIVVDDTDVIVIR